MASKTKTPVKSPIPAIPGPNLAPATLFPQYTSGAWANLPTGVLGNPVPPPPPPGPAPLPGQGQGGHQGQGRLTMGGGGIGQYAGQMLSAIPQQWQDRAASRWPTIGGGQPMPTSVDAFMAARNAYRQANPQQYMGMFGGGNHG